jgi:hypothetical protein
MKCYMLRVARCLPCVACVACCLHVGWPRVMSVDIAHMQCYGSKTECIKCGSPRPSRAKTDHVYLRTPAHRRVQVSTGVHNAYSPRPYRGEGRRRITIRCNYNVTRRLFHRGSTHAFGTVVHRTAASQPHLLGEPCSAVHPGMGGMGPGSDFGAPTNAARPGDWVCSACNATVSLVCPHRRASTATAPAACRHVAGKRQ